EASAIKSGLPMPFTSISAGWIFTLMGLLDDGRPLNQGKSPQDYPEPGAEIQVICLQVGALGW
ncbi:hypothetical protein, partial [Thiolapillus sp.]|uniref:hypothetical protein n=1 Tax=Thiolapillus sp. TaxID=2017437 RepID=UPI003AF6D790